MRILFPTKGLGVLDDFICHFFSAANNFVVVEIEKKKIKKVEVYPNPVQDVKENFEERTAVAAISDLDIDVVIADVVSDTAKRIFEQNGIRVLVGFNSTIKEAVEKFLETI